MKVSFIIPHKGRLEMLKETIISILNLDYEQSQIEVIIVSQNKTLVVEELVGSIQTNQVKIILADDKGTIAKSRNIGAEKADGDFLAFLDADINLSANWLIVMLDEIQKDDKRKIIASVQINSSQPSIVERIRTLMISATSDSNVDALAGANLFMNSKDFWLAEGFPEELTTCEDIYFTSKVAKIGLLYCTSKTNHVHLGEDKSWSQMFYKEIWRGQSNIKSLFGRSIPLREYPSLLVPIWIFFFAIIASISLLLGEFGSTLCFLLFIILPVFLYSLRLNQMAKGKMKFTVIVKFYLIYFAARAIGTVIGVTKSFKVRDSA
jgi:glycosyltransferase involved in cell wall biosynthesis